MAKSNAKKCQEWRARQPKKLDLPMPEGTRRVLDELMQWHDFEDGREAITTMLHRLHELGPDKSRALFEVSRHQIEITEEMAQRLQAEGARMREV
jgi:hypothetical protein